MDLERLRYMFCKQGIQLCFCIAIYQRHVLCLVFLYSHEETVLEMAGQQKF